MFIIIKRLFLIFLCKKHFYCIIFLTARYTAEITSMYDIMVGFIESGEQQIFSLWHRILNRWKFDSVAKRKKISHRGASQSRANIISERIKKLAAHPAPTSRTGLACTMAKLILKYCRTIGRRVHFSTSNVGGAPANKCSWYTGGPSFNADC